MSTATEADYKKIFNSLEEIDKFISFPLMKKNKLEFYVNFVTISKTIKIEDVRNFFSNYTDVNDSKLFKYSITDNYILVGFLIDHMHFKNH